VFLSGKNKKHYAEDENQFQRKEEIQAYWFG